MVRIRLGFHKSVGAYRNPSVSPCGLPAPLSGALFSLPPLGEVLRSGKGGVVGDFELLPFIEQHPLSQPCRFRSAVKSASSPIGEPSPTSPERFSRCSRPRRRTAASCKAEDGATAPEGSGAVCRIPFEMHQGKFVHPLGFPRGWCSAQRIKIIMIAGGNHTLIQ